MKAYKLAIFDLDGTLLDTLQDLANSTNHALRKMDFPTRTTLEIRSFVGNGVQKLVERAVPQGTNKTNTEKVLSFFKEHYAEHCEDETKPYEGIIALLNELQHNNVLIAVVSNKINSAVSVLCQKYFGDCIVMSVGDREGVQKKPAPDAIFEVLDVLNIAKEDSVYIGDSEVDIKTAINAKMDCVSVTWGFRDKDDLMQTWISESKAFSENLAYENGIFYGDGIAYFASSVPELKKILLCKEK